MKPFFRALSVGFWLLVLGQGLVWAETGPASPLSNSEAAAVVSNELSSLGTSLAAESQNNSAEVESSVDNQENAVEIQRDNLILAVKFYIPNATILCERKGKIYFACVGKQEIYCLKKTRVEKISKETPAEYAVLQLRDLSRWDREILGKNAANALAASLRDSTESVDSATSNTPASQGSTPASGAVLDYTKLPIVNLILAGKYYVPEVTLFYNQDGMIHFKYEEDDTVYGITRDKVETVAKEIPKTYIKLSPGVLVKNQVLTRLDQVQYPRVPHRRGNLIGKSRYIKNTVTFEPLGLILGTGTFRYEHVFGRHLSMVGGLKLGNAALMEAVGYSPRLSYGAEAALRFFPMDYIYAPRGPWLGFTGEFVNDFFKDFNTSVSYRKAVAEVGWKFVFINDRKGAVVSPYIGVGYSWSSGGPLIDKKNGRTQIAPNAPQVYILGLDYGYGF